jgi:hypothetical protein
MTTVNLTAHYRNVCSSAIAVELEVADAELSDLAAVAAERIDTIEELATNSPDMPGGLTYAAFGSGSADDSQWELVEISTPDGDPLWRESSSADYLAEDLRKAREQIGELTEQGTLLRASIAAMLRALDPWPAAKDAATRASIDAVYPTGDPLAQVRELLDQYDRGEHGWPETARKIRAVR